MTQTPNLADVGAPPADIDQLLKRGHERLHRLSSTARLDAELLLAHVLEATRASLGAHGEVRPAPERVLRYQELIERRARGEPIAYLTGEREFWSLSLTVTADVLVPRPETELAVERCLALYGAQSINAADLGTGSGAIALALAHERPAWRIVATDRSVAALGVARANATRLGLHQVRFACGDWLGALGPDGQSCFDLIVSNPPYVAAGDPHLRDLGYEPAGALTPGLSGMEALEAILRSAPPYLVRGGWLVLEHGHDQGARLAGALVAAGYARVRSHADLAGHDRVTEAQWPGAWEDISMVQFETSHGNFTIDLYEKDAPLTVANFLQYVDDGFFDGTIFHRIVPGFVIQGGGLTADFDQKKTREPVKNEADNGVRNQRGTLSMARTNDVNSATSQFFVNLADNEFLDNRPGNFGYAVFGRVTHGMDVIDKIAKVKTGRRKMYTDAPMEDVLIKSARRTEKAK